MNALVLLCAMIVVILAALYGLNVYFKRRAEREWAATHPEPADVVDDEEPTPLRAIAQPQCRCGHPASAHREARGGCGANVATEYGARWCLCTQFTLATPQQLRARAPRATRQDGAA